MKNLVLFSLLIFVAGILLAADEKLPVNIQSWTIEPFEDVARNNQWQIKGSPSVDLTKTKVQSMPGGPAALAVLSELNEKKDNCLGIKAAFKSMGYNWIELIPPEPIKFKGRVKSIDFWVCGMNYRYTVEIWVRDHLGFEHKLVMGRIDFEGWRNLLAEIPPWIPQEEVYLPKEHPLSLTRIVFRSDPDERADKFFCYIDHIKLITNTYIKRYDGDDITTKSW